MSDKVREAWLFFREKNPDWTPKPPEPPAPPKRDVWVSPDLFEALLNACREVERWQGWPLEEEVAGRLHLWPETGFSLPERIILAETVWMDTPTPPGGKGHMYARLDHWLSQADEKFSLRESGAVEAARALGNIHVYVDWDGSFEPYTLRLPGEKRLRNPSVRVFGV